MGGGQFKQMVRTIIEAESQPIRTLEARKGVEEGKLKLFQEFKGKFAQIDRALSEFTDFRKFRDLKVDLGDGQNLVGVTVDKDRAEPGSYQIQIEQMAARTSVITNGFEDPDAKILGLGYVTADLPNGDSVEVYIDHDNSSLRGVAALVNARQDLPFRATVVQDFGDAEEPWRLMFTAKKDGLPNELVFPELYFMDGKRDVFLDNSNDAQNALLKIDGFEIEAPGNQVSEFLQGVNLEIKQADANKTFTLKISEDYQKASGKVKELVGQLNNILEFINKQNSVDDKSDTRTMFTGDSSLQTIEYRIRNLLHEGFPVSRVNEDGEKYQSRITLTEMGVGFGGKDGKLTFNEEKFQKVLGSDFDGVVEALTGQYGFAAQIRDVLSGYTRPGNGLLATREQSFRQKIRRMDDEIDRKTARLEQRQKSLTDQFSRLQGTLAGMQQQQAYLQSALGAGGGNIVSQLLGG